MEWGAVCRVDLYVRNDRDETTVLTFRHGKDGAMHLSPDVWSVPREPSDTGDEVPYYWPFDDPAKYWHEVEEQRRERKRRLEEEKAYWRDRAQKEREEREEELARACEVALRMAGEAASVSSYDVANEAQATVRNSSVALQRLVKEGLLEPCEEEGKRRYRRPGVIQ